MTYFHNAYERTYYKDGQSLRRPTPWVFEQIVKGTLVRTMRAMVQYTPTLEELKYYKANELDKLIYKVKNSNLLWNRKINERMKSNQVNLSRMRCYVGNTETNAWEAWKQSKKECSSVDGLTFCPKLYDGESGGIGELLQIGGGRYIQTFNPESIPKPWEGEYTEKGLRLIHAFESLIYAWAESEKDAETLMWFFAASNKAHG